MLAFEDQAAVNLVGENHDVAIANCFPDRPHIFLAENSARRIMRRIQNDELGAIRYPAREIIHVEAKGTFLPQMNRNSTRPDELDHRLVNRKSRIGIDDFVALFYQSKNREEDDWLAPRNDYHFFRADLQTATLRDILSHSLA